MPHPNPDEDGLFIAYQALNRADEWRRIEPERVLACNCSRCFAQCRLLEAPLLKIIEQIDVSGAIHGFGPLND